MLTPSEGLRQKAARLGISLGCFPDAMEPDGTWGPAYLLQREFDMLVSKAFHWSALQPDGPDCWQWAGADRAVAMAERLGLRLRGHALVWYQMLPAWLAELGSRRERERCLCAHIQALVSRYRGRIVSWDAVNEAVWLPDGRPDGLRRDVLLETFGEAYLDLAFHTAAEADPGAELVLNEALLVHRKHAAQRRAFVELLHRLRGRGVPVHAAGIQAHIGWDDGLPMGRLDPDGLRVMMGELGALGLGVLVTELDVFDPKLPRETAARDAAVADLYREFLAAVLDVEALRSVFFWGCGDSGSWYNTYVRRVMPERLPPPPWRSRPLLFDDSYAPKPAYFAVARCFDEATLPASDEAPPRASAHVAF